jgi:ferritin
MDKLKLIGDDKAGMYIFDRDITSMEGKEEAAEGK